MALKPASLQWSDDGSVESLDYGDVYFQRGQGLAESRYIYLDQNDLPARFTKIEPGGCFSIAELGFGTGLNFLVAAELFLKQAPEDTLLHYISFEKHPLLQADLDRIYDYWKDDLPLTAELLSRQPPLVEGFHTLPLAEGRIRLTLVYGDARDMLPQLSGKVDAWFLDGFAPKTNPDMWEDAMLLDIGQRTKTGGSLATFTVAGKVWRGLEAAGFDVTKVKGFGIKWSMIAAKMPGTATSGTAAAAAARRNIAVIGAGIAGCSAARALADRHHNIVVIDRHETAAMEASGNPVGIVYPKMTADPSPSGHYYMTSFSYARAQLQSMQLPSWQPCGVLHMDMDADGKKRHEAIPARNGYPADVAVYREGAGLSDTGLFQAMGGAVSPAEWCARMLDHAHIQKLYGTSIARLEKTDAGWRLWDGFGNAVIEADTVIIACANDTLQLEQTAWLPLQSLRGQLTFLKPTAASRQMQHVICHDGYIAPLQDGCHTAGASFQKEAPGIPDTRHGDDIETLEKLQRHLPTLGFSAGDIAGARAAYRATTPDKLPVIGPAPLYDDFVEAFAALRHGGTADDAKEAYHAGLYLCTGFGSHGLTTAPLAGEIIAAMIDETALPVSKNLLRHITPARLILRDLKRKKI